MTDFSFLPGWAPLVALGIAALLVSTWAAVADRRRMRRSDPDAVGFMPWRGIGFVTSAVTIVSLGAAAKLWLAG